MGLSSISVVVSCVVTQLYIYCIWNSPWCIDAFLFSDSGVIHVQSATCGRTSSQICSIGRPQSETSNWGLFNRCPRGFWMVAVFFTMGCVCTYFYLFIFFYAHHCISACLLPYCKIGKKKKNSTWGNSMSEFIVLNKGEKYLGDLFLQRF